jgi:hypothetical protein
MYIQIIFKYFALCARCKIFARFVVKHFTTKVTKEAQQGFLLSMLLLSFSCSPDLTDDPIPVAFFEPIVINLSLPEYNNLNTVGFIYMGGSAGVRGIILHKKASNLYYAFERNCSYQPNSACATVDADGSNLFMIDACCGSTFNWDGNPTGGPAWRPLRQYETYLNGNELTITDEIAN